MPFVKGHRGQGPLLRLRCSLHGVGIDGFAGDNARAMNT